MKRVIFAILFLFVLGCATAPISCLFNQSSDKTVFYNEWGADKIEQAKKNLTVVDTFVSIKVSETSFAVVPQKAIAVLLPDGYILALAHASSQTYKDEIPADKELSRQYFTYDQEIDFIGEKEDIALFRFKNYQKKEGEKFLTFGDSKDVQLGDKILVLGFSYSKKINIKDGVVSVLEMGSKENPDPEKHFMISAPCNPGDSGSPAIAKNQKGEFVLVGVVQSGLLYARGISICLPIDYVRQTIEEIKNAKK